MRKKIEIKVKKRYKLYFQSSGYMRSPYDVLIGLAFRYLSIRQRSEQEMYNYLHKKMQTLHTEGQNNSIKDTVLTVMVRLKELGYIDDRKFAENWVLQRNRMKQKGNYILKNELLAKGIDKEIILDILENKDFGNEDMRIRMLIHKKARLLQRYPRNILENKLLQFIVRRGFNPSHVRKIIDEWKENDYNNFCD